MTSRILAVVCAAALCTACLKSTTLITVRPDGSGTIDQELGMTAEAMSMMRSFRDSAGDANKKKSEELFTEADARKAGDGMGVRFVSMEPVKTPQLEGYRAKYAFDDITKVTFKDKRPGSLDSSSSSTPGAGVPPFGFGFAKGADSSTLSINMPPMESAKLGQMGAMAGEGGKNKPADAQAKQAMAMMKMMMHGMFVDVSLAVDGKIRKTNAPFVNGGRITLLQLDFDKMLADETAFDRMEKAKDLKSLQDIPGLKVPAEPKLSIEFAR